MFFINFNKNFNEEYIPIYFIILSYNILKYIILTRNIMIFFYVTKNTMLIQSFNKICYSIIKLNLNMYNY